MTSPTLSSPNQHFLILSSSLRAWGLFGPLPAYPQISHHGATAQGAYTVQSLHRNLFMIPYKQYFPTFTSLHQGMRQLRRSKPLEVWPTIHLH